MMMIQFFVSDVEMRKYFEACGYQVVIKEETRWRPAYHNRTEPYEVEELHVQVNEKSSIKASELFEQTIKAQLMRTDLSAKLAIKTAIGVLRKNQ